MFGLLPVLSDDPFPDQRYSEASSASTSLAQSSMASHILFQTVQSSRLSKGAQMTRCRYLLEARTALHSAASPRCAELDS